MKSYITIIICSLAVLFFGVKGCQQEVKLSSFINTQKLLIKQSQDSAKHYKDLYGKEHAYAEKLIVNKLYLENELKQVSKELKIKPKQIKSITGVTTDGKFKTVIRDTVYSFKDNDVYIYRNKDTFGFELKDSLIITDYWKRRWFLGRKRYYIDISNTNQYIRIKKIVAREIKR